MKMFRTHTMIVLASSFLFMLVAGVVLGWTWYEVNRVGAELIERVAVISNQQTTQATNKELSEILEETMTERITLETYVLQDEDDTIKLLARLESLAILGGVSLTTNSLSLEESGGTFNDLLLSINIEGSEESVKHFIEILETLPYHGRVEKVLLSVSETEDNITLTESTILLKLSMTSYD